MRQSRPFRLPIVCLLAALVAPIAAHAGEAGAFAGLVEPYEAIRLALLDDKLDGVAGEAATLKARAEAIADNFSTARAGVSEADAKELSALLPGLVKAAGQLAEAKEIAAARAAYGDVSAALVTWRGMVSEGPAVAYCPMAGKSWLQPKGEIGNPYYGQSMATCGAFEEE